MGGSSIYTFLKASPQLTHKNKKALSEDELAGTHLTTNSLVALTVAVSLKYRYPATPQSISYASLLQYIERGRNTPGRGPPQPHKLSLILVK